MATNKEEAEQRRQRLLAARSKCLAQMGDDARLAFEQRVGLTPRPKYQKDPAAGAECTEDQDMVHGHPLVQEIRDLIEEVRRLRQKAEQRQDIRTALRAVDTAVRAIQLYGRTTGVISDRGRAEKVAVKAEITRDEGIQTAAGLLLELATAGEIRHLFERLQQRLLELETGSDIQKTAANSDLASPEPECPHVVPLGNSDWTGGEPEPGGKSDS